MNSKKENQNKEMTRKRFNKYIPSLITSLRIIFLPLFIYVFFLDLKALSFLIFVFLSLTDLADGYVARKMNVSSSKGAYFDTIADFILILSAFTIFAIKGFYPYWILGLIIFMFLQFVLSSKIKMPVYDPLGKYFGTILFGGALITLIFENTILYGAIALFILIFAVMSLLSRYIFLFIRWRKSKKF
jgi:CDP-diacylglycerol--glycerol-3-phosphate 3-phosphatidyltransferase/cardiolipin synthase